MSADLHPFSPLVVATGVVVRHRIRRGRDFAEVAKRLPHGLDQIGRDGTYWYECEDCPPRMLARLLRFLARRREPDDAGSGS